MAYMRKYRKTTPRERYDARCTEIDKRTEIIEQAERKVIQLSVKINELRSDHLAQARREAAGDPDEFDRIMAGVTDAAAIITRDIEQQEQLITEHRLVIEELMAKNRRVLSDVGGRPERLMR